MSVLDAELYVASCALQYAANISPRRQYAANLSIHSRVVSLGAYNQATIKTVSRPGYSYQVPLLRNICKATATLLH